MTLYIVLLKLYAGFMAIQFSMESHQYKLFETKSNAIWPLTTDLPLYSVGIVTKGLCQKEKL